MEVSDRSTPDEIERVIAQSARADAVIMGVFVRTLSGSGRMDLPGPLARLVNGLGASARTQGAPVVAVVLGNPYVAAALPDVPVLALTYDWSVLAERAAVRALLGEQPIRGRLPVSLGPPEWPRGFGLTR